MANPEGQLPRVRSSPKRLVVSSALASIVIMLASTVVAQAWAGRINAVSASPFSCIAPDTAQEIAYWQEQDRLLQAGRHYKSLRVFSDQPGVTQPALVVVADNIETPDSTPIVGVEINGQACALVLDSMSDIDRHVVNLVIGNNPISVAYCDLADCVRVVKDDRTESASPIPLRVGGLDINHQLVLLLRGERYGQQSLGLPLQDHPFTRTSLGEWKKRHPKTWLYVDPPPTREMATDTSS
jgi:hypothetical protein